MWEKLYHKQTNTNSVRSTFAASGPFESTGTCPSRTFQSNRELSASSAFQSPLVIHLVSIQKVITLQGLQQADICLVINTKSTALSKLPCNPFKPQISFPRFLTNQPAAYRLPQHDTRVCLSLANSISGSSDQMNVLQSSMETAEVLLSDEWSSFTT